MTVLEVLSAYSIAAIWGVLLVNVFLSVGGFVFYTRIHHQPPIPQPQEYPMVSMLVPAHNEAVVIGRTVKALLAMDYPHHLCEIIVINDNSQDASRTVLEELQRQHPHRRLLVLSTDKIAGGKGKSNALNLGYQLAQGTVLAIYDADNTPEPGSLRLLVQKLLTDAKWGAVIGKFRTRNKTASLITRFVNIETLAYQCMNQAGRSFFFGLCTIPGTNFVIRRHVLEEIGGWEEGALSEDTEISFRLYRAGYRIGFMPLAVTWEQEPQTLPVWFRQRTRWAKGNLHVLYANFPYLFDSSAGPMRLDVLYYVLIYVLMLSSLICSDIVFFLGLLGFAHVSLSGFSTLLWGMAILMFVLNILLTLAVEKNEFGFTSALLILLMLFTYSKLWVAVVVYALLQLLGDALWKREAKWYKTERADETVSSGKARKT